MKLEEYTILPGPWRDPLWELYYRLFEDINRKAALRHRLYEHEFMDLAADEEITKVVGLDDTGSACAVAAMTNNLQHVPLISTEFYAELYGQEMIDAGRMFYVMFIGDDPIRAGHGAYHKIIEHMSAPIAKVKGVAALDLCAERERVGEHTFAILRKLYGDRVGMHDNDVQKSVAFDFLDV